MPGGGVSAGAAICDLFSALCDKAASCGLLDNEEAGLNFCGGITAACVEYAGDIYAPPAVVAIIECIADRYSGASCSVFNDPTDEEMYDLLQPCIPFDISHIGDTPGGATSGGGI